MADCNSCANHQTPPPVPYIVHEAEMARAERTSKRLCVVICIQTALAAFLLFARLLGW